MFKHKKLFGQLTVFVLLLACLITGCSTGPSAPPDTPKNSTDNSMTVLPRPEAVGFSSQKLNEAYLYSRTIQTAGVVITYKDKVLKQWGDITTKYLLHSCRKSFMSALFGLLVEEDRSLLLKTMAELGINDNSPSLSNTEKTATVHMLIKARSGVYHEAAAESAGMKAARPVRHSHAPGTFWYYNNWDFNVIGTIFRRQTGRDIFEELKIRIADPIGMVDFEPENGSYQYEDCSIHPAYHMRLSARDMARFGILFLQKGKWRDEQVLPESWIEESTKSYSEAGSYGGYGYMWWVAVDGRHLPNVTMKNAFSARGYGGHYILVIPDEDLVIVHRVNTDIGNAVSSVEFGTLVSKILDAKLN